MRWRARQVAAGLTLVLGGATASLLAGSGPAAAAPPPVVVGSCATTIQGAPGTPIALSPTAVLDPVLRIVNAVPLIGPGLSGQVRSALAGMGDIPLGAIPGTNSTISGSTIAAAAVPRIQSALSGIPVLGPVLGGVIGQVQSTLATGCAITVTVVNSAAAPVQSGAGAVAGAVEQGAAALPSLPNLIPGAPGVPTKPGTNPGTNPGPGGTPQPGGTPGGSGGLPGANSQVIGGLLPGGLPLYGSDLGFGRSPMTDYSSIPFSSAGLYSPAPGVRYGGAVPGYSPQFGILGSGDADGVQAAGHAEVMDAPASRGIELPVLLAVFALAGVTAALVRTWVLRRATT
ncbi:hypothetical protein [Actinokineospora enzanensis]|uniref:hypothetical protein n=1 Tax=Actinokineospora enzanensis TaxID=155975 RepID=UPI0003688931|nr:hypothetical protein [Actinokineospora enzanensis]